jgi:hypothetical protein
MTIDLVEVFPETCATLADNLCRSIQNAIRTAPNNQLLQQRLDSIDSTEKLACFLHRFLHFNDALAARVPYLAGLIHLSPTLFSDPTDIEAFCRQRSASIAAHIAAAAIDEYRTADGRNMVHQHLSQAFFRGVLRHFELDGSEFNSRYPLPPVLTGLLHEARTMFFDRVGTQPIFGAIGFHVGLEFFANEEFNLVDAFLGAHYPNLVVALQDGTEAGSAPYTWLSLHTVLEIDHYRAGLEAVRESIRYCSPCEAAPQMGQQILAGLNAFANLQRRFYYVALSDFAGPA